MKNLLAIHHYNLYNEKMTKTKVNKIKDLNGKINFAVKSLNHKYF